MSSEKEIVIDVEIIKNHLPEGDYFVLVNKDSFDDNVFDYAMRVYEAQCENSQAQDDFVEIMAVRNHPKDAYCVQGEVGFYNTKTEQIFWTKEFHVKAAEDISLIPMDYFLPEAIETKFLIQGI